METRSTQSKIRKEDERPEAAKCKSYHRVKRYRDKVKQCTAMYSDMKEKDRIRKQLARQKAREARNNRLLEKDGRNEEIQSQSKTQA